MREELKRCDKQIEQDDWDLDLGADTPDGEEDSSVDKTKEKIERKKRSIRSAVLAKCHDCMGSYHDGRRDCENPRCSLYPYMPFRKLEPDFEWCEYNSRKIGKKKETYDAEAAERARERIMKTIWSNETAS